MIIGFLVVKTESVTTLPSGYTRLRSIDRVYPFPRHNLSVFHRTDRQKPFVRLADSVRNHHIGMID